MSKLRTMRNWPIIGAFVRRFFKYAANREAGNIASHFATYLQPLYANNAALREACFKLRHNVYCEELGFEELRENGLESDDFDSQSFHCLVKHKASGRYTGTVRIICSSNDEELLPIEKYCRSAIENEHIQPDKLPRDEICEISRLAVHPDFRRRQSDKFAGAETGVINQDSYSEKELRCFPFIAVGLYLSAASLAMQKGKEHCFVMMEPRLARSMKFIGIHFQQVGPVVNYHGRRAPYYANKELLFKWLSPGFLKLLELIEQEFQTQISELDE